MKFSAPIFLKAVVAAFPRDRRPSATEAANLLLPFVDQNFRQHSIKMDVCNNTIRIPRRVHFIGLSEAELGQELALLPTVQCLRTRSTDGYERQAALQHILTLNEP
ncbi:MAG: hypothetical protein KGJ62_05575 [Armatimonadetes bacterium]|nr:hypothetical protein [Armatimonadota bacterium]MDE2207555.1 hypothetical protein [Armatimonadota bacterium]